MGVKTSIVRRVHSKIVICDDVICCAGSFNWFSADRHGQYKNYEISIAYQGNGLAKEIDIVKNDLLQTGITVGIVICLAFVDRMRLI